MNPIDGAHYICTTCAQEYGGTWPPMHAATMHQGKCDVCGVLRPLANVGDWNWPDGVKRGMRD